MLIKLPKNKEVKNNVECLKQLIVFSQIYYNMHLNSGPDSSLCRLIFFQIHVNTICIYCESIVQCDVSERQVYNFQIRRKSTQAFVLPYRNYTGKNYI